jgi:hypothetical protein
VYSFADAEIRAFLAPGLRLAPPNAAGADGFVTPVAFGVNVFSIDGVTRG